MSHNSVFANIPVASPNDAHRPPDSASRPRRQQVSKACTWCREYRIKCDAAIPCRNCKAKGRNCTSERGQKEVRTFSAAMKEIGRLNDRIKELEEKLQEAQLLETGHEDAESEATRNQMHDTRSHNTSRKPPIPTHLDPLAELGVHKKYYNWDVVSTRRSNPHQQTYGTSSSFYYAHQMTVYMDTVLKERHTLTIFNTEYNPVGSNPRCEMHSSSDAGSASTPIVEGCDLSRPAEEAYLSEFWNHFPTGAFVVNRQEFETYYDTLWQSPRAVRSSSALVDILIALCLQRHAQLSATQPSKRNLQSPGIAGTWWRRRGQRLLEEESEEPSLTTFQCHLLSVMWLSNAGLHNTAHSAMASCIRIGIILGLHLEPPGSLTVEQREVRKRLWWTAYALEMKFAMDLGRPIAVNCRQVTCGLPLDDAVVLDGEKNELLFNVHLIKLFLASRAVYITFYQQCAKELERSSKESIYEDLAVLEECARFLDSKIVYLRTWAKHVPRILHAKRRLGKAFNVEDVELQLDDITAASPSTRQSLLLELHYHAMAMNLFRPFIVFSAKHPAMPKTQDHALSCVKHATTITSILRQTCIEADYLNGVLEVWQWQWQWSAALSLVGYILTHPKHPFTTCARRSVDAAISVLELHSKYEEAEIIRKLVANADILRSGARNSGEDTFSENFREQTIVQPPDQEWNYDLDWKFWLELSDSAGSSNRSLNANGVTYGAGQLFPLQGIEPGDQSMFDLLNFEGMEGFES